MEKESVVAREMVMLDGGLRWYCHDYPHPLARWHYHPEIEIHAITATSGTALIGGVARLFTPGSVFMLGSGVPHNWLSSLPEGQVVAGRDVLVQAEAQYVEHLAQVAPDLVQLQALVVRARQGLQFFGDTRTRAVLLLEQMRDVHGPARTIMFLQLLQFFASADPDDVAIIDPEFSGITLEAGDDELYARAISYIYRHLSQPLRIGDIAQLLHLSESSVSRLFTRATTVGFSRTVIRVRLTEAYRLLRETTIPISDICYQVGFSSLSNFNRRFREESGTTPRRYRQLMTPDR